jgi:formyl-CoA transferase
VSAWSVYDTFDVAQGEQLFIGAVSDKQFLALCEVLQRPDLAAIRRWPPMPSAWPCGPSCCAPGREHIGLRDRCLVRTPQGGRPALCQGVRPDQLVHDEHLLASGGLVPMQRRGRAPRPCCCPC